jgi:hypothetical protein
LPGLDPVTGSLDALHGPHGFVVIVFFDEVRELSLGDVEPLRLSLELLVERLQVPAVWGVDLRVGKDLLFLHRAVRTSTRERLVFLRQRGSRTVVRRSLMIQ